MTVTTEVKANDRLSILSVAAHFTSHREDPAAVAINAGPLLAWAEAAAGSHDLAVRIRSLRQHDYNRAGCGPGDPATDNPDEFLRGAGVLYAFATDGDPS